MKYTVRFAIAAFALVVFTLQVKATDFNWDNPVSVSLSDNTGCASSAYTFSQKSSNSNDAVINPGAAVTITFPAGTDASTFTGGTFNGTAISGVTATAGQITFNAPVAVPKKTTFDIIVNGITNGNNINGECTVIVDNTSGGINSGTAGDYSFTTTTCPVPPSLDGTFESGTSFAANAMTVVSDATNYWIVGTATDNGGSNSAYVTNDGSSNAYTSTVSVSHFYFDYSFPAGETDIALDFDWKCDGESTYDYMKVYVVETTTTPVAGTLLSSGEVGVTYNQQTSWQNESLALDAAYAGTTKRIVFTWRNDGSVNNDPPAAVDNIAITTQVPPGMVYTSSTVTQTNTTSVAFGTTDQHIIGIEVVTTNPGNPLDITSFSFTTTGTTDPVTDIQNAKLYSTGTSNVFATTNQVGSTVALPNGSFTVTPAHTLAEGTNYFWLTYDITAGATINNVVDARCTSLTVGGTAYTPSVTDPPGNREILNITTIGTGTSCDYQLPVYLSSSGSSYTYSRTMSVYEASELGTAGNISQISWNKCDAVGYTGGDAEMRIYIKHTSATTVSTTSGTWESEITGATLVYSSSSQNFNTFSGWQDFPFSTVFPYNGTDNIIVFVDFYRPGAASGDYMNWEYTTKTGMNACFAQTSSSEPYSYWGGANNRPNIQIIKSAPTAMSYASCTVIQNTGDVSINTINQPVISVRIVMDGSLSPMDVTSFSFNTNGTTSPAIDVQNAKLYSTGTSSTFSTTNQIGSTVVAPNGSFTITPAHTLSYGTNYFWLAYDIPSGATENNYVDAECTSVTVGGTAYTPSVTAPAGNRKIVNTLTIGTGTDTNSDYPFDNYWENEKTQMLFTQSELGSATMLTSIALDFNTITADADNRDFDNFTIKLKHTGSTSLTGAFEDMSSAITVFSNSDYNMPTVTGWHTWDISDFYYNGTDNLLIEFTWGDNGETAGSTDIYKVNCTDMGADYVAYGYADSETPPSFDYENVSRPNICLGRIAPSDMTFVSCTATQNNTTIVGPDTHDAEVIGIEIVTNGALNAFDATSFVFNTSGTTDAATDISNAKLWYSAGNASFATSNQVGAAIPNPDGSFTITGTQILQNGTNYFWLTYDVGPGATENNFIDAQCTSITVDGVSRTPAVQAPSGNREIIVEYCTFSSSSASYYIDNFSTSNGTSDITNNNSGYSTGGYGDFLTKNVSQEQGLSVDFSADFGSSTSYTFGLGIWIDWNTDGDFTDTGEEVFMSDSYASSYTGTITVPVAATVGDKVMRVVANYSDSSPEACGSISSGEAEDYTFSVEAGTPMNFNSLTATQPNTTDVMLGTQKAEIICVEIDMGGNVTPLNASGFVFSTNGSTAADTDVENARLYYTGTSSTFATTTQIGGSEASVNGAFTINGTQTLCSGTNYFWLTYDIIPGANVGDLVDAELTSVNIGGSIELPGTSAPAGNRQIIACGLGTGFNNITLPFFATGESTSGAVDDFQSTDFVNVCGSSSYYTGEDYFYVFTPAGSGNITIGLTSAGSYTGIVLYEGCPFSYGTCNGYSQSSSGDESMCAWVDAGQTYYLLVDSYSTPESNDYDITISAPSGDNTGRICSTAEEIASLPFVSTGNSTACTGDDYNSGSASACSSGYLTGEDYVYSYTITSPECISIELDNCGTSASVSVYDGCPDDAASACLGTAHNSTLPFTGVFSLPEAGTYYIVVDSDASGSYSISYDISIISNGSAQSNDLPCNAIYMAVGSVYTGDNSCASGYDEPSTPACWDSGSLNTVWFSTVVPASGNVKVRTELLSLTNTQIAVYKGDCDNLTYISCNDDQSSCGSNVYNMSELSVTGETPGDTLYIVVDGYDDLSGTFTIAVIDGDDDFPYAFGQDCGIDYAIPLCNSTFNVGNPGYQAVGNHCDFGSGQNCLTSGERGSVWYLVNIDVDGDFDFTLVPNDYDGTNYSETDYDFAIWKVTGSGAVTCSDISSGATPDRCNYSADGITGLSAGATASEVGYDAVYDDAFESSLPVLAGEQYLLVISNYTNSTSGFDIDFVSSPLIYPTDPTSLTWTGGAGNTDWFDPLNWGNCGVIPDETIDVVIPPSSLYQPVIDDTDPGDGSNARCKNITINPGANLTIDNGYKLEIYGNYSNNGTLSCNLTAEIMIEGGNNQTLAGNMTGLSRFEILRVSKTGGNLTANSDIEVADMFITTDANSVLNINDKNFTTGGDFLLFSSSTFVGTGTGSAFTFNGASVQVYNTGSGTALQLNDIVVSNTSGGVALNSDLVCSASGSLSFVSGLVNPGAHDVVCLNTSPGSVDQGNSSSYVNGSLRHYISTTTGTYNFPVGESDRYTLAQIVNNNLTGATYLEADFNSTFTNSGTINPLAALDNTVPYTSVASEGVWNIIPDNLITGGSYDILIYFDDGSGYDIDGTPLGNGFTGLEDNKFAVLKRPSSSTSAADWIGEPAGTIPPDGTVGRLVSSCFAKRSGITSFSQFAIGKTNIVLPVEMLSFTAECFHGNVELYWNTASELNNDYFTVFRSFNGVDYTPVARIDGMGNSMQEHEYLYLDEDPGQESRYYKLRQTDFDGSSSWSDVVFINCAKDMGKFYISPNPFTNYLDIVFAEPVMDETRLVLVDVLGEEIIAKNIPVETINYKLNDLSDMKPGTYYLKLMSKDNVYTGKIVKM